jgi:nicotinate-nucleotide pyrophosphorylase (carboxylating)
MDDLSLVEHLGAARRVGKEFRQLDWDSAVEEDCRHVIRLAVREDLDRLFDWTTVCLVPPGVKGEAAVVARKCGVVAGLRAAAAAIDEMDASLQFCPSAEDGAAIAAGQTLATLSGSARSMLTAERIMLNLLARLSGIATLTRQFVDAVRGTSARIYDTRKTTPGWRRLEKYAVRCGGGYNHRTGLFDAILIKDNHLALGAAGQGSAHISPAEAVKRARAFVDALANGPHGRELPLEIEVDTLEQLDQVLREGTDLVLLDNMPLEMLREAVAGRDALAPAVELEASGGVTRQTVSGIAATGVDRISVGALTHSAVALDVGMDWR